MGLLDGQSACLRRPEGNQDTDSQLGLNVDLLHINFFFHRMDGRMVGGMTAKRVHNRFRPKCTTNMRQR